MNLIGIVILVFLILEVMNVLALYFAPGSKYANSMGVFNAWEKSKLDPEVHDLVSYLVNWVAGTKLIFILLLIVILVQSDEQTLVLTGMAMSLSIASFFWRLFPQIRRMDRAAQITPKNYSAMLGWMILVFILVFSAATVATLVM